MDFERVESDVDASNKRRIWTSDGSRRQLVAIDPYLLLHQANQAAAASFRQPACRQTMTPDCLPNASAAHAK